MGSDKMYAKIVIDKKLFLILIFLSISILFMLLITIGMFFIYYNHEVYFKLMLFVLYFLFFIFLFVILGIFTILISQPNKKAHPLLLAWMKWSFRFFYPFLYATGNLVGIEKDQLRGLYTQLNNYLVGKDRIKVQAKDLLLLAPQCIQRTECSYKITTNINNCMGCGRCKVVDLIHISNKYGVQLSVVTGGTSARKNIIEKKPKAIVAIACERDLSSGMHDVKMIPVIGIINDRPEGPCHNTLVDVEKVENSIQYFLEGGDL